MVCVLRFERLESESIPWAQLEAFGDRTIYQTEAWLRFILATQGGELVVARLRADHETLGYFSGVVVRRYGLRMLGSPFPGWTTDYMGFNLCSNVGYSDLLRALERLAFHELGCIHLEVMDRHFTVSHHPHAGFRYRLYTGYEIDLRQSEDQLLASMTSACRRCIRKADKCGVVVEEATDNGFAEEYYAQLQDVFAKQSLVPTYDLRRVQALLHWMLPTGRLLLLRARDPQGACIGTGIFPAMNGTMYFWGGASWRHGQILRPNEAIQWYAMRYWRDRGMHTYDMGGQAEYKRKFGGYPISVPWFRVSKYPGLPLLRGVAQGLTKLSQSARGRRLRRPQSTRRQVPGGGPARFGPDA